MYVFTFYQRFEVPPVDLHRIVEDWLEYKLNNRNARAILADGGSVRGPNGQVLECPPMLQDPFWSAFSLEHPDRDVSGRLWRVTAGVRALPDGGSEASVVTETVEVSTLSALSTPQVTRPYFVTEWLKHFVPAFQPKVSPHLVNHESLHALIDALNDSARIHPVLVVSTDNQGRSRFNVDRFASLAQGLVQVVQVDKNFNTRHPEYSGQRWGVYRGGVAMVFPATRHWNGQGWFLPIERYGPDHLDALDLTNIDVANHLHQRFLHRTNLSFVRRHIGPNVLREVRTELETSSRIRALLESAGPSPEQLEIVRQLSGALDDTRGKAKAAEEHWYEAQQAAEDAEERAATAEQRANSLQAQLDQKRSAAAKGSLPSKPFVDAVLAALTGDALTPEQVLRALELAFPDRVKVLDTAFESARESAVFHKKDKVALRLKQLVIEYVDGMRKGKGDRVGLDVFGKVNYAAKESEIREENHAARRKRTFTYQGREYYMERHLKIDMGRSAVDGWRCHFHWLPEEGIVLIGYCGKHLDFK